MSVNILAILVKEMLRSAPAKNLLRQGFSLAGAKFAPTWPLSSS
jgi:hypothetical protein